MKFSKVPSTIAVFLSLSATSLATPTLVAFGDSYTDQSRIATFENGSYPSPHYQEIYPPTVLAANGGTSWVRYVEMYGGINAINYAVSGAACSNLLTPRPNGPAIWPGHLFPDVTYYEIPALKTDYLNNKTQTLTLSSADTVYSIWIGTNDVGINGLLTGNQTAGVTIVNVTSCVLDWAETLYSLGARNFLFMNMVPLELSPLYGVFPQPLDRYWPYPRNRTMYSLQMRELVNAGNALWDLMVPNFANSHKGVKAGVFNSNQFFRDIYDYPQRYLNGTAPLNVTGYCAHSNITGGDTVVCDNPDSYMWYDSLHPSEETDRNLAREIVKVLSEASDYVTFSGSGAWPKL